MSRFDTSPGLTDEWRGHVTAAVRLVARRVSTFSAFRHRDFRLFYAGQTTSLIGSWLQIVALSWLVLELTDSAFYVGLVSTLESLPVLAFSLYAGVIVDRTSRHQLVLVTQTSLLLLSATLATLTLLKMVTVPYILILSALVGAVMAFDIPARMALVTEVVGKEDLTNAYALNVAAFNVTRILGPALGGILIGLIGVGWCFALNAVSYLAVLRALFRMKPSPFQAPHGGSSTWAHIQEGVRHVLADPRVRAIMLLTAVFSIFGFPFLVLLPVFARNVLARGAQTYGWMMASVGVGAVIGALLLATYARRIPKGPVLRWMAPLFGLLLAMLSLAQELLPALLLLVLIGFSMVVSTSLANSLLQTLTPDALRGRVISVYTLAFVGLAPLGSLQAGALAERFGAPTAVAAGGTLCAGIAWVLLRNRELATTA